MICTQHLTPSDHCVMLHVAELQQLRERQNERRRKCEAVVKGTDIPLPQSIPDIDALLQLCDELQARLAQVEKERDDAFGEINAAWLAIERGWEIEPRGYFENEAPQNGFESPLAQAVHHMWKRKTKETT